MRVSPAGRAAIRQREGCRLDAYRDSRGIWTIGVGHAATGLPPKPYAGMRITAAQADAFLAADLAPVEATIAKYVRVPLSQNECDALASLGFNIGVGGLARSSVVSRLNKGDRAGAAEAFTLWAHPSELMGRRKEERTQFLRPDAPAAAPIPVAEVAKPAPSSAPTRIGSARPAVPAAVPAARPGLVARLALYFGRHDPA